MEMWILGVPEVEQKVVSWLTSAEAKNELGNALEQVRQVNAAFQKAREVDPQELAQPVTV